MQSRILHDEINMFEWGDSSRLMTVIRGIPMYLSSGNNSGFKNTWFPHLGIDGRRWIRKPRLCLPSDIIAFCHQLTLDQKIALRRFGNTQSICISASIGTGFWKTDDGVNLMLFLNQKYRHYFLSHDELIEINKAQQSCHDGQVSDIATANSYLMRYGSWIQVDYRSRLPSDEEYSFFVTADNQKIRAALSMMLTSKHRITTASYNMICKLSEDAALFNYALNNGLLETHKNINQLTNLIVTQNKALKLHDLIKLNSLNNLLLPFHYKYFKNKYACRKILRQLHHTALTARIFDIIEKLDRLHLLDRYADLIVDDEARLGLIYLDNIAQLNCKMIRVLWKIYKNHKHGIYLEPPGDIHAATHTPPQTSTFKSNCLFSMKNETIDWSEMPNQPASSRLSNFAKR